MNNNSSIESKGLALLRVLQILEKYSDYDHPLTQAKIAEYLERDYGIVVERKNIGRKLSLLKEALEKDEIYIESNKKGSYLSNRSIEDSELKLLIDGVLSSKYITAKHSKQLIDKLCGLSNVHFRSHVKNIFSVNDWSKTDNQDLFFNIELVDEAIDRKKQLKFDFHRYYQDKQMHKAATHTVSPYLLVLHNQRYYLMALEQGWNNISFYRVDHIKNMEILEDSTLTDIRTLPEYPNGIDYRDLATARPYMYADRAEHVEFVAPRWLSDQIIDWFGYDVTFTEFGDKQIRVALKVSPKAMLHWAMQFGAYVEVVQPQHLRETIRDTVAKAHARYTRDPI